MPWGRDVYIQIGNGNWWCSHISDLDHQLDLWSYVIACCIDQMIVLLCNIRLTAYLILLLFYHHGVNLLNSSSLSSKIFSGCIVTVGEVRSRWLLGSDGRSQGQWQTLYHTLDKPLYPTIPAPHLTSSTSPLFPTMHYQPIS